MDGSPLSARYLELQERYRSLRSDQLQVELAAHMDSLRSQYHELQSMTEDAWGEMADKFGAALDRAEGALESVNDGAGAPADGSTTYSGSRSPIPPPRD